MQEAAAPYIFRTLRLEGQKILRVFLAYIFGKYFFGICFFFQKLGGYYDFTAPFPLNEEGPVHTIYYILVHLEQKELFPSMQIICQDSSTVFWQSQRQIFARYTHTNTLYLSLYTQTIHIVFVICILVRKKGEIERSISKSFFVDRPVSDLAF